MPTKGMYKIEPVINFLPNISLPTCMYKVNSMYDTLSHPQNTNQEGLNLADIESHQLTVLKSLENLKNKVLDLKKELGVSDHSPVQHSKDCGKFQDIVIKANPSLPPLSLWVFCGLLQQSTPIRLSTYLHSSLTKVPDFLKTLHSSDPSVQCNLSLSVIWRGAEKDHEIMVNPLQQGIIEGEVNIARYISRFLFPEYSSNPVVSTQIDDWLEVVHCSIIHGNNKDRQGALRSLNGHLGKSSFLVGDKLTVADVVAWSAIVQAKLHGALPTNVEKWFKLLLGNDAFRSCNEYVKF